MFRLFIAVFFIINSVFSQEKKLSEKEVKSAKPTTFILRSQKKADTDTKVQNESVGKKLAELLNRTPSDLHSLDGLRVRRVLPGKEKFGADVISLETNTNFGHIHSLQRIVAGFVQKAYNYHEDDSYLIASYILYYNAYHREDMEYIQGKYVPEISASVSGSKLGLSRNYEYWPGRTQIIIPIEPNILKKTNKDVTLDELAEINPLLDKSKADEKKKLADLSREKLKDEKNQLKDRKEIVKIEEAELDIAKRRIDENLEILKKDPLANKDRIAELEKEKTILLKKEIKLTEVKEGVKDKEDRIAKKEGKTPAKETAESKKEIPKKEVKEEKTAEVPVKKETVEVPEKKVPETVAEPVKTTEPAEETKDAVALKKEEKEPEDDKEKIIIENPETLKKLEEIAKELEAKKEEEKKKQEFSDNVFSGRIPFIKPVTLNEGQCSNELHILDPAKDDFIYKSEFNRICGRNFQIFNGMILVVGGFQEASGDVRLVLLGSRNLARAGNSEVKVYIKTHMEVNGEFLYAVEQDKGKYYYARFDKNLKREVRTSAEINPDSTIVFYGRKIYIYGKSPDTGNIEIKVFDRETLKFLKKTQS
ncbi:MAG TPA: P83/100 family protein [Leptospiraceae bacterium]|nr:P83/100 family protein [Leptospiraceae bacterium]HMY65563.1 P83/100 family protein [Leptospiraceae bacterium]HMZ57676.1 P83/100 family protein [Leptospiraceae bacterium]HNI25086.1 P83/100 family protein [Leptospiraceae bacterium]HNI95250.1 P83/100 family protein [Leptospiraceae bacterium]